MGATNAGQEIGIREHHYTSSPEEAIYAPHPIANRTFAFKDSTMAAGENASMGLVRLDESMREHPYVAAIKKSLIRLESMSTVRSDGIDPDLMHLLHLELVRDLGKKTAREQKAYLRKRFACSSTSTIEASFEAFRCLEALEWIDAYTPKEDGLSVDDIWTLYGMFMRGTKREAVGGIRTTNEQGHLKSFNSGVLYIPPDAERLSDLLEDLVAFCNRKSVPVFVRSTVEHFQLEAIKPVDEGLDRWGRMIALLIWKQSGMMENVIPPFSLTPALQTKTHTELLIPYQTGQDFTKHSAMDALDRWVAHCALATARSVRYAATCRDSVERLQEMWRDRLRGVTPNSALDLLLIELAGMPLITVSRAAALTEKRFQVASEVIDKLVDAKILEPLTRGRRNRVFVAREALEWLDGTSQHLFSEKAVAREAFFRQ